MSLMQELLEYVSAVAAGYATADELDEVRDELLDKLSDAQAVRLQHTLAQLDHDHARLQELLYTEPDQVQKAIMEGQGVYLRWPDLMLAYPHVSDWNGRDGVTFVGDPNLIRQVLNAAKDGVYNPLSS